MAPGQVTARFDDQQGSFVLGDPIHIVKTDNIGGVRQALQEVEEWAVAGRWCAGYVAYEAGVAFDHALRTHQPIAGLPLVWFGVFAQREWTDAPRGNAYDLEGWDPSISEQTYIESIDRIKAYIAAGDTYQVNHTFRLRSRFRGDPMGLYADLAAAQRGDYAAFVDIGTHQIASASPELFFRWGEGAIEVKPMKGTTPRGRWPAEDRRYADRLRNSDKERAENLMIVDLLRNDLGKLARIGSVSADRLFEIERYPTVWQLTSTISAEPVDGTTLPDVFAALFPSGSVTGAPKVRTMEIIEELEIDPRGVYCGAIGLVGPARGGIEAQFNVAIRTVVIDATTQIAEFGVGGGITWDSTSEEEYQETFWKAAVLKRPLSNDIALFETIRWDGDYLFLKGHLDRIVGSADYFGLACSRADLQGELKVLEENLDAPTRVRLELRPTGQILAEVVETLTATFADRFDDAPLITVGLATRPVQSDDPLLFHKTTDRTVYDRARSEVAADEALLVNEDGELTEATTSNLAIRIDGTWLTPPLTSGCLPGVYREVLLASGRLAERVLTPGDLQAGDAIGLVNSLRGWRRAQLVDIPIIEAR